jgi:hypothetical protein
MEDRMLSGSYKEAAGQRAEQFESKTKATPTEFYIPPPSHEEDPSNREEPSNTKSDDDPFGLE